LATTESMFRIPNTNLHYRTGDNINNFMASVTYHFGPSPPLATPVSPSP
jgi:hypothetical protein